MTCFPLRYTFASAIAVLLLLGELFRLAKVIARKSIAKNALCRKNHQISHKRDESRNLQIRWCWNLIWRYILGWYKIILRRFLTFWNFMRGSKFKFSPFTLKFELWPHEKLRKIKSSKITAIQFCITPKYISRPNFSIKRLVGF